VRDLRAQGEGKDLPDAHGHALREGPQLPVLRPSNKQAVVQGLLGSGAHNQKVKENTRHRKAAFKRPRRVAERKEV